MTLYQELFDDRQLAFPFSELMSSEGSDPKLTFLEMFERELGIHGIQWCKGECGRNSHRRAFADPKSRTVHMSHKVTQRSVLLTGLHEIGYIVANTPDMKRWQREKTATQWAYERMKELGINVPRQARQDYRDYVGRMKQWGKNIAAGRKLNRAKRGVLNTRVPPRSHV